MVDDDVANREWNSHQFNCFREICRRVDFDAQRRQLLSDTPRCLFKI